MDKNVEISMLLSFYGSILTDKQKDTLELYYNDDLSLSEIAEILSITRQGVRDCIKRGEGVLYETEKKLGLCKRFFFVKKDLENIKEIADSIASETGSDKISDLARKIIFSADDISNRF